ncbi:unnamed protein product [Urochloa humidicola]
MAIPLPAGVYWPGPLCGSLSTGVAKPAAMRHGLDPSTVDDPQNTILGLLYAWIPNPPVSPAATLSCAAAPSPTSSTAASSPAARLPAKDGARTAALSTRWRGLWRSAPLVLVDTHFLPCGGAQVGRPPRPGPASRTVRLAVSAALDAHPGPFPFVSLSCGFMKAVDADRAVLAHWFQILATKGVEELAFVNRPWPIQGLRLPAALFSCGSLRRLYLGAWRFVDTATLPRGASFPNLQELVLGAVALEDRDLEFLLAVCPVLDSLAILGDIHPLHARIASHSLRCVQFCCSFLVEVAVEDTPRLERLFIWRCWSHRRSGRKLGTKVKIGNAPRLGMLGYLEPGVQELQINNTIIKYGTMPSPNTVIPSVHMLALHMHFRVRNEVRMLPAFLRCFPNVETLCIQSDQTSEPTGNLNINFWQQTAPIECVQSHLKTLVLREFNGEDNEFAFLKFIAETAQVLEKMVLVMALRMPSAPEDLMAKMKALDSARWASGSSKVGYLISRLGEEGGSIWNLKAGMDYSCNDPFFCL